MREVGGKGRDEGGERRGSVCLLLSSRLLEWSTGGLRGCIRDSEERKEERVEEKIDRGIEVREAFCTGENR